MPNVLLFNGSPTQDGSDGTLVTSGNPVTPDLLTTGVDAETTPLKLAIRTNPGYERAGPSAISIQGPNATKWSLAPDSNGAPGSWGVWGAALILSPKLKPTNQLFWIKARVTSDESYPTLFNDLTVTLSLPDDAYLLVAVGRSLNEPYGVIANASRALGLVYTIKNIVGRSLDQPYLGVGQAGRSNFLSYTILAFPTRSLSMPYSVKVAVGKSLDQPCTIKNAVGRSNNLPYGVGDIYAGTVLATTGIQSYWKLQETGLGTIVDSKGAINGTVVSSSVLSYAQATGLTALGTAIKSNGSSPSGIDFGNNYAFGGTADYSIEFWAKRTGNSGRIISHYDENLGKGWHVGYDGAGKIYSQRHTGSAGIDVTSTVQLSNSQFDHVVVTYTNSDGKLRIYLNGVLDATSSGTQTASVTANTLPLSMFRTPVGTTAIFCDVALSHAAIYNVALSLSTITNHYNVGASVPAGPTAIGRSCALPYTVGTVSTTADTFADSDGTLATAHSPTGGSGTWTEPNISSGGVAARIYANRLAQVESGGPYSQELHLSRAHVASVAATEIDIFIGTGIVTPSGAYAMTTVRCQGAYGSYNAYRAGLQKDGTLWLQKILAGAAQGGMPADDTSMGSLTVGQTYTLRIEATPSGANQIVKTYVNGVLKQTFTDTSSPITGNGDRVAIQLRGDGLNSSGTGGMQVDALRIE